MCVCTPPLATTRGARMQRTPRGARGRNDRAAIGSIHLGWWATLGPVPSARADRGLRRAGQRLRERPATTDLSQHGPAWVNRRRDAARRRAGGGWCRPSRRGPWWTLTEIFLQVATLGRGRLGALQLVEHGAEVLPRARRASKLTLPSGTCTLPYRSVRYSTLPPLNSATAAPTSVVTVPVLGFGIRPRGPSTRPSRPTMGIRSGVAMATSKSSMPFSISAAGRRRRRSRRRRPGACWAASPLANTATRTSLPVPGQRHGAAHHLVGLAGVDAEADGHLDGLVELGRCHRLHESQRLDGREQLVAVVLLDRISELLAGHECLPQG